MHMVDHIGLSGTHHHDHNTDGTGFIRPTSAPAMASASKLAIIIALLEISAWVMI